jgi:short-subunit dehydrogenase
MKKAIIIGASSGIGRALAHHLSEKGYHLGLVSRRDELLHELQQELPLKSYVKRVDVVQTKHAQETVYELIREMDGVELIIFCSGTGFVNPDLNWRLEKETIDVNVTGFCSMANLAMHYFNEKGFGHFVSISSIAAIRGNDAAPAYNASKAFMTHYMEGLRKRCVKSGKPIYITDILPGFVDTEMARGEKLFWVATPKKAAAQIYEAIVRKKKMAYVTKRWRLIAWLLKIVPDSIYNKLA